MSVRKKRTAAAVDSSQERGLEEDGMRERFFEFDVSDTGILTTNEMAIFVIACFFPANMLDGLADDDDDDKSDVEVVEGRREGAGGCR